ERAPPADRRAGPRRRLPRLAGARSVAPRPLRLGPQPAGRQRGSGGGGRRGGGAGAAHLVPPRPVLGTRRSHHGKLRGTAGGARLPPLAEHV
ncbi:MAG: Acylphosphate phosphohydrolase, putative, partial [uncultured Acetobacteraceae bacterium]